LLSITVYTIHNDQFHRNVLTFSNTI